MLSAKLRHRVTIEQVAITRDQWGGAIETWTTFMANVPAEIKPLSGREFVAAAAMQAGVNTRITVRQVDGLKPTMRLVHGTTRYNIRAILPDPTLKRHLTLMCEGGVNDG